MIIWACNTGVNLHFIKPGKPTENAFVECFNGRARDESPNKHWFTSFEEANRIVQVWKHDYNNVRQHSALGNSTPAQLARSKTEKDFSGQLATIGVSCKQSANKDLSSGEPHSIHILSVEGHYLAAARQLAQSDRMMVM